MNTAIGRTGLSPSMELLSRRLGPKPDTDRALPNTTLHDGLSAAGFGAELFPLHSPLLWESHLVSFPALNDMLKFSAYSSTPEVEIYTTHTQHIRVEKHQSARAWLNTIVCVSACVSSSLETTPFSRKRRASMAHICIYV